jgi:peptidoglycan/LPS O-acetylase OafA/YrhL
VNRDHLPALDGLRGVAVLLVLWDHAPQAIFPSWMRTLVQTTHPGGFGVDLFFVLSGFLITRILLAEREAGVPVRYFLLRRAARIFPIYYLLLSAMAVLHPHREIPWCAVYLSNYYPSFHETGSASWLRHTWSLCVEEHFYSCWPLLVAFLPVRWSRRLITLVVIPATILAGALITLLPRIGPAWSAIEQLVASGQLEQFERLGLVLFGTQCRMLSLAIGALLAFHESALRRAWTGSLAVAALGGALAWLLSRSTPALCDALGAAFPGPFPAKDWRVLIGVVATSLATSSVMLGVIAIEERARSPARLLELAPLRGIGRISYGLYLFHLPLFGRLDVHGLAKEGRTLEVWGVLALLFAVATLSYFLLERPILRWASRFRTAPASRRHAAVATAGPAGGD